MPVSKIIGANAQKHGTALIAVSPANISSVSYQSESYDTSSDNLLPPMSVAQLSGQYLNRFNDRVYYSYPSGGT